MIRINEKYRSLYTSEDDLIIITGGRGSGKSFVVADWACRVTYQKGEKLLYTRYTLKSAEMSIIPEYKEKIELFNAENDFEIKTNTITNKLTGTIIHFLGIKTSAGIQTANLKSIKNPTKWILDEAEELPDYNTFQKIKRSLRKKDAKIQTILILNSSDPNRWIYKYFFVKNNIPNFYNGSVNGITFIHTDYLDNIDNLDDAFINDANKTKENDELEYRSVFLGEWLDFEAKYIFNPNILKRFKMADLKAIDKHLFRQNINYTDIAYDGTDSFCSIVGSIIDNKVYIIDALFTNLNFKDRDDLLIELLNKNKVKTYAIETNAGGSYFGDKIEKVYKNNYISIKSKTNKIVRIMTESKTIIDNFYFLDNSEIIPDSYYDNYFRELTSYHTLKKKEDDAPDATAGLSNICRIDLGMFE